MHGVSASPKLVPLKYNKTAVASDAIKLLLVTKQEHNIFLNIPTNGCPCAVSIAADLGKLTHTLYKEASVYRSHEH